MASRPGAEALRRQLDGPLPRGLAKAPDDDLARLADLLAAARRRQADDLAAAGERELSFVPRLLRAPLMKVLVR